jgi:hypothetical protein
MAFKGGSFKPLSALGDVLLGHILDWTDTMAGIQAGSMKSMTMVL